jgi:hypothetical protein
MRIPHSIAILLCLSACASQQADKARRLLIGRDINDAETCLGIPSRTDRLSDGSHIAEWDYQSSSTSASIPLADMALLPVTIPLSLAGSISISGSGDCHAIAHVSDGRVVSLRYSGASGGLSGSDAECRSIVRGCLRMFHEEKSQ